MATASTFRFYWERIDGDYFIFDSLRGSGANAENYIARAVDVSAAEMICLLMNKGVAR